MRTNNLNMGEVLYPFDRVNRVIWTQNTTYRQDEIITGSEEKGLACIDVQINEVDWKGSWVLTPLDKWLYIAIYSITLAKNKLGEKVYITYNEISNLLGANKPFTEYTIENIIRPSLHKMNYTMIKIDNIDETEVRHNKRFTCNERLLPFEELSDDNYVGFTVSDEAVFSLMKFAQARNSVAKIDSRLFCVYQNFSQGEITLEDYMVFRIVCARFFAEHPDEDSDTDEKGIVKIELDTICRVCDLTHYGSQEALTEKPNKVGKMTPGRLENIMNKYKKNGVIENYFITTDKKDAKIVIYVNIIGEWIEV